MRKENGGKARLSKFIIVVIITIIYLFICSFLAKFQ